MKWQDPILPHPGPPVFRLGGSLATRQQELGGQRCHSAECSLDSSSSSAPETNSAFFFSFFFFPLRASG